MSRGGQPGRYEPHVEGIVLSVGRTYALGIIKGRRISGKPAGMLKDMIAYRYLSGIGGPALALKKFIQWRHHAAAMRRG